MAAEFRHTISMEAPLVRSSSRLEAYSDALFSIVATVMVLPVAHTEIPEDEALSSSFARLFLPKIIVYFYTFWIVSLLWTRHVQLFEIIDRVDEFSVLMNLAMMMVITFFPFSFTLLAAYPFSGIAVQIFCGAFIVLQGLRILLTWHLFRHPGMLKNEIKENHEEDTEKKKLYVSSAIVLILSTLAFIVSFFLEPLALVILILLPFGDYFWSCIGKLYTKCRGSGEDLSPLVTFVPWRKRLLQETICKERIEFFSDGVFAIVATLTILDICEENIPDKQTVDDHGGKLDPVLEKDSYIFLAYAGTFLTFGLQWYVHHSLLHYVKEVSKLMMVLNFLCLMTVGMSPMAFKMTSTFDKHKGDNNESIAIQVNSTIILLTGLFQSALWIAALFDSEKCLFEPARHKGKDHTYLACKLVVLPLLSLLMFFLSLVPAFRATIFIGVQISAVAIYILLGLLFTEMRKWTRRRQLDTVLADNSTSLGDNLGYPNPVEF